MNDMRQKIRDLNEKIAKIDAKLAVWGRSPRGSIGASLITRLKAQRADLLQAKMIWEHKARGNG